MLRIAFILYCALSKLSTARAEEQILSVARMSSSAASDAVYAVCACASISMLHSDERN